MKKIIIAVFTGLVFIAQVVAAATQKGEWKWSKYGIEKNDNPCATPVAYEGWKVNQFKAWKKTDYSRWGIDMVFLGDSITAGWRFHPKYPNGAKVLKKYKKQYKINPYSFAISGDEPQNVLWLLTEGNILKGVSPKVITLMIGINSLNRKKSPEQVAGGVRTVLDVLRKKQPQAKILLLGVWPCWGPKHVVRDKVTKTNELISKFADWKNIFYLDFGPEFVAAKGNLNSEYIRDGIHPSEKGYEKWGALMFPYLVDLKKTGGSGDIWNKVKGQSANTNSQE